MDLSPNQHIIILLLNIIIIFVFLHRLVCKIKVVIDHLLQSTADVHHKLLKVWIWTKSGMLSALCRGLVSGGRRCHGYSIVFTQQWQLAFSLMLAIS